MYSVPGYSAFQPVSYPGIVQPTPTIASQSNNSDISSSKFVTFPIIPKKETPQIQKDIEKNVSGTSESKPQNNVSKTQTDFEEKFVPEVVSTVPTSEGSKPQVNESKLSVASLSQGSSSTGTIPPQNMNKDIKKKPPERFSLKTSIPISKIDMKCVSTPPDSLYQNSLPKKPFNPAFHTPTLKENGPKIEIQSNIVIKSATNDEIKDNTMPPNNSISTLINAAEVINKSDIQFKTPEPISEISNETTESTFTPQTTTASSSPLFNPMNLDNTKSNFPPKPPDPSFSEPKNQIVFIQNKNQSNTKMLLAIQQQNPQVLLQRTNFDSKNLQAPSRPSNQTKKCKEELVNENGTSSKVVSLKRMHQDNCDENDFENLITENQIYGNKIVVKEKSQGTLQEQDLKNKSKSEKPSQAEPKNVVLQPNFVYLSNVQFPANLMMIKNNTKVTESTKIRVASNENKQNDITTLTNSNDLHKPNKTQNVPVSKEIHVLKSSNNVLQTLPNKNNKTDIVFQTPNQKVIMNPQIVYQVPMIIDSDNKINQTFVKDYPKIIGQSKRDLQKPYDQTKPTNDKLYIACPYQMDSKLQPKIVITNIRPKITMVDEISTLDIYEQRKRLRRMKYLSNRDSKSSQNSETHKQDIKKVHDNFKNIITPEKMKEEIYKEYANTKVSVNEDNNESDSDYGEDDFDKYQSIIEEYRQPVENKESAENDLRKAEFLANFRLATQASYKEIELDRQEKILQRDSVASAYIAAGRIDCFQKEEKNTEKSRVKTSNFEKLNIESIEKDERVDQLKKRTFLSNLNLRKVSPHYRDGYEKVWFEILKERKRRDDPTDCSKSEKQARLQSKFVDLDPGGQLEILTEIKKHVNENNNLIKKRFDTYFEDGESIKILAEKNFSELNRLSKLADRSVKHFSGQETRKRDLNPGFDSENIPKPNNVGKYYPNINIPNISKIISLKTLHSAESLASSQATSMDEPQNCAGGIKNITDNNVEKSQDFSCQADEVSSWPGLEVIVKNYREYEIVRKKEIADLYKRNTALRVESAQITRAASRDSDRARALLAERRNLANEERGVRNCIQWLYNVVEIVRNYDEKWA